MGFSMSIRTQQGDMATRLYLMGIKPQRPIRLSDNLIVEPATCNPNPDAMINAIMNQNTGSRSEIDLGILISTLRQTKAQLLIRAEDANQLATFAWNAQTDITLSAGLTRKEVYWHVQCNTRAEDFSEDSRVNIVNSTRMYIPKKVYTIEEAECAWLEDNFHAASKLMSDKRFSTAINSLWAFRMNLNPSMQMAVLWAGIESLVGAGSYELAHRISTISSLFLERDAEKARKIKNLYNARSKAVHEGYVKHSSDVDESAVLLHELILKCVETHSLPDEEELLFCR